MKPEPSNAGLRTTDGAASIGAVVPPRRADAEHLPTPSELRARHPLTPAMAAAIARSRAAIADVLHGRDDSRFVAVVGPCSIHDADEALEYAARLGRLAQRLSDRVVIVMRSYFEKPRTRVGWKGFLHDPDLDGSDDMPRGIERTRALLVGLAELGVACGSELLDPIAAPYFDDLLSWACVGARTSESQVHRQLASGAPMPVGFKNATSGDISVAHDALAAARRPHSALGVDASGRAVVRRHPGNPDVHLVLRGGAGMPNDDAETVEWAAARARREGVARPIFVDCSHDNSGKDHRLQGQVCERVLALRRRGQRALAGVMLESFLEPGRQAPSPGAALQKGVSITDACIGWAETEDLLERIAESSGGT